MGTHASGRGGGTAPRIRKQSRECTRATNAVSTIQRDAAEDVHCRTTAPPDPLPAPDVKPTLPCPAQPTLPSCEHLPAREVSETLGVRESPPSYSLSASASACAHAVPRGHGTRPSSHPCPPRTHTSAQPRTRAQSPAARQSRRRTPERLSEGEAPGQAGTSRQTAEEEAASTVADKSMPMSVCRR